MCSFDDAVAVFNSGLHYYLNGDPGPVNALLSRNDDVTLCNPIGPPRRGHAEVERAAAEPSSHFSGGKVNGLDEVSRFATPDLGYVVRVERGRAHIDGSPELIPYSLRVTMIFRREGEAWKLVHRHADPITTARPLATAMEQPPKGHPLP